MHLHHLARLFLVVGLCARLHAQDANYRSVLVAVIDDVTGAPVQGVKVTTEYWGEEKIRASLKLRSNTAVTNEEGRATLWVYKGALDESKWLTPESVAVAYELEVKNDLYENHFSQSPSTSKATRYLIERPASDSPSRPDFVFRMQSKANQMAAKKARDEIDERNEKLADLWLKTRPDFWPSTEGKMYFDAEWKLVNKRWESGKEVSRDASESKEVEKVVLSHITQPNPGIHEIRRISESVFMVYGGWYSGPMAAASSLYVVKKVGAKWSVIQEYLVVIS